MDDPIDMAAETTGTQGEIGEDLSCPMCGYNLRGLREARCPECGYACEWEDLVDPTRRLHPYLFEHHPEKNVRSFLRTAVGTLLPRRFWRDLHPAQPGDRRRLILYWCAAMGVYLIGAFGFALAISFNDAQKKIVQMSPAMRKQWLTELRSAFKRGVIVGKWKSAEEYADSRYPNRLTVSLVWGTFQSNYAGILAELSAVPILWPWLTIAVLMIFRWSMQKAKVLNIHVMRCALYSFDLLIWMGLAYWALGFVALGLSITGQGLDEAYFMLSVPIVMILGSYRLWMGYRGYLRFNHALATVLSSQVIVFLVWLVAVLFPVHFSWL